MEIPLAVWQFLAGGAGGLVRGIVGVTKDKTFLPAQAGNPDTFKFQWFILSTCPERSRRMPKENILLFQ